MDQLRYNVPLDLGRGMARHELPIGDYKGSRRTLQLPAYMAGWSYLKGSDATAASPDCLEHRGATMHPDIAKRIDKPIPAVAETADFGPAYNGEDYVTLTFRVPKDTPAIVGTWELTPRGGKASSFAWAVQKNPVEE